MLKSTTFLFFLTLLSFLSSCSSSDSPQTILEDVLDKDAVTLSNLSQHDITYEKTSDNTTHIERYCPSGVLRDTNNTVTGSWSVTGNDIVLNTGRTYKTTNTSLEKNMTYNTETTDVYKVVKISETVCL
jgi:hypothetical protein